jgi:predicted TIM-barrel fold metal-dependent hydrolase
VINMTRGIRNDDAYHALIRTYNRWLVEEYCSADPERLIGVGCIPSRGLDKAMEELERAAEAGLKLVGISRFPSGKDYPTPEDDRFWAAAIPSHGTGPSSIHRNRRHTNGRPIT